MFAYTVACTFTSEETADAWCNWLRDEHLRDVCEAGALCGEVVRIDAEPAGAAQVRCEVRYHFASRAAFEAYEREHAPRLRDEGLARFPLSMGLQYVRSTGDIVCERQR